MSIKEYHFKVPAEYEYDDSQLEIINGQVMLKSDGAGGYYNGASKIMPVEAMSISTLVGITGLWVQQDIDDITFVLNLNGQDKWWDGSAWLDSSSSAESNELVEIIDGLFILEDIISPADDFKVGVYLHGDGKKTPVLHNLVISYFGDEHPLPVINKCLVWGRVMGLNGKPVKDVQVSASLKRMVIYDGSTLIANSLEVTKTDDAGYWELLLANNEKMQYPKDTGIGKPYYQFTFAGSGISLRETRYVLDTAVEEYKNLEYILGSNL